MNKFTDRAARQAETRNILDQEILQLSSGYIPILGRVVTAKGITSATPLSQALREAAQKVNGAKSTKRDLRSILNFVAEGAEQLGIAKQPVGVTSRKHIKLLLLQIESSQKTQSPHRFNKIRSYLMILFNELIELEALESNPVREIAKQQPLQPLRKVLTQDQRRDIGLYLREKHYSFWRFMQIFFHSGSRLTELMNLTIKEVNLTDQAFTVVVKKGCAVSR
jgi:site-specific recombinase XerD